MKDDVVSVTNEVERILLSPYMASLHDLNDLAIQRSRMVLSQWAGQKPCQVASLARVILEQLPQSSAAVDLLEKFGYIQEFRDAVLKQKPAVLDQLLQSAMAGEEKALRPGVSFLSSPLPESIAHPACLPNFIAMLVEKMAKNPSAGTIRLLYHVIAGLSGKNSRLCALPEEMMANVHAKSTRMLRNLSDQMGNLLCVATLARISSGRGTEGSREGPGNAPATWLQNIHHLFGPKRGQKTLDLVFRYVVMACSEINGHWVAHEAWDGIQLAQDIGRSVDGQQKMRWIQNNGVRIAKLCERVARGNIDIQLQIMGLAFLVTFLPGSLLPDEIRRLAQSRLLEGNSISLRLVPDRVAESLIESVVPLCDESSISAMLQFSVSVLQQDVTQNDSFTKMKFATLFIKTVGQFVSKTKALTVLRGVSSIGSKIQDLISSSFPMEPRQPHCEGSEVCHHAYSSAQNLLLVELLALSSTVTMLVTRPDHDSDRSNALNQFTSYTTQINRRTSRRDPCAFVQRMWWRRSDPPTLRMTADAMEINIGNDPTQDWKSKIADALIQDARVSHKSMIQIVEETCQDLERRCDQVGAPLQAMTEERDRWALQVETLKKRNRELEVQMKEASQLIAILNHKVAGLDSKARSVSARAEDLAVRLSTKEKELGESQDHANSERENARTRELNLMAMVTGREEQLDETREVWQETRCENEKLKGEIVRLRDSLASEIARSSDRNAELLMLRAEKEKMILEMDEIRVKSEREILEERLRVEKQHHESDVALLNQKRPAEIAKATSGAQQQAFRHRGEIHASMQAVECKWGKKLQSRCRKIQSLEKEVQSRGKERAAIAKELVEAQEEHDDRQMNITVFKQGSESHQPTDPSSQQKARSRPVKMQGEAKGQSQRGPLQLPLRNSPSSPTSNDSGPSPKRSKNSRRSLRVSDLPPFSECEDVQSQEASPCEYYSESSVAERRPLTQTDGNRPTKSSQRSSKGSASDSHDSQRTQSSQAKVHLDDLEWEFDDEQLLMSTQAK